MERWAKGLRAVVLVVLMGEREGRRGGGRLASWWAGRDRRGENAQGGGSVGLGLVKKRWSGICAIV